MKSLFTVTLYYTAASRKVPKRKDYAVVATDEFAAEIIARRALDATGDARPGVLVEAVTRGHGECCEIATV